MAAHARTAAWSAPRIGSEATRTPESCDDQRQRPVGVHQHQPRLAHQPVKRVVVDPVALARHAVLDLHARRDRLAGAAQGHLVGQQQLRAAHGASSASRATASSSSSSDTISGGSRRIVTGPVALTHQPLLEQGSHGELGCGDLRIHVDRQHKTSPADGRDVRQRREPGREPVAGDAHPREQFGIGADLERDERRRRNHRAARESRAVIAGVQRVREPWAGDQRADRQAATERLRARDRVGDDVGLLVRPERPGPPHTRLDLVEDQRRPRPVARLARRDQEVVGQTGGSRSRPGSARAARPRSPRRPRQTARPDPSGRRRTPGRAARTAPAWSPAASPTARRRCVRGTPLQKPRRSRPAARAERA